MSPEINTKSPKKPKIKIPKHKTQKLGEIDPSLPIPRLTDGVLLSFYLLSFLDNGPFVLPSPILKLICMELNRSMEGSDCSPVSDCKQPSVPLSSPSIPPLPSPPVPVSTELKNELIQIATLFKQEPARMFDNSSIPSIVKLVSHLNEVLDQFTIRGKYKCIPGRSEVFVYAKAEGNIAPEAEKTINFSGKNVIGTTPDGQEVISSWLDRKYP